MKAKWALSPLIVLGMLTASAIAAHAKAPTIYRITDVGAGAYYSAVDESGCIWTNIFVEFGEEASRTPSNPTQHPTLAYMYVSQWDACSGVQLKFGQTNPPPVLPAGAIQVASSLKSASLNATVELLDDYTGSTFTADVSITWKAIGQFERSSYHDHYKAEWGVFNANTRSLSRDATVAGSVIVEGSNLTQAPWSGQAWIEKEIQGSISILKKP